METQFDKINFVTPTPEQQADEVKQLDPKSLKAELKGVIKDNMRAGVLDRDQLKSAVKGYIKTKINEQILRKAIPKEGKSVSGFFKNLKSDAIEIVDGFGAIIGMSAVAVSAPFKDVLSTPLVLKDTWTGQDTGARNDRTINGLNTFTENTTKMITSPAYRNEVYQTYVKPIIDDYKEYRHPLQKAYEDPLGVILDVSTILSGGAAVAGRGAQASKAAATAAEVAGNTGKASMLAKTGTALEATASALDKAQVFKWSNISAGTKAVLNKVPGGPELLTAWKQASEARGVLNKNQVAFLSARNKILGELDGKINALSPEEAAILPNVVEGFKQVPTDASPQFREALGMVRALADDQARFGLSTGTLTNEIIERRKFQPLNTFLQKADSAEGAAFKSMIDDATPYTELSGAALRGRIDTIKKFFPDADPVYMRHFFDDSPKRFSSFFLNTTPVRSFKPGFLRKSYGKEGYIGSSAVTKEQLKDVLGRQAVENLKWQKNMSLIEQLKTHPMTKELKRGEKPLPGYKIFAPDGMLRFYKGTMDLEAEFKKAINKAERAGTIDAAHWEDIFGDVAETVFKKQDYIGVTKAKLYQVPESFAKQLNNPAFNTNPYIKLFWDEPLNAFRFFSLSMSPRWQFNNIVGNMLFSVISGDAFNPKAFYLYKQAKKAGLLPDELSAGLHRAERTTSGRLGAAAEIPMVKSAIMMHEALLDTRVVGTIVKNIERSVNWGVVKPLTKVGNVSMKINEAVDEMFKGAAYINKALINERKGFIKRMTISMDESMKILESTKLNEASREAVINSVHDWYYHGLNLTNFERRVVRRAIPFYSWMRWATLYAYRITTETPIRANIIANMSRDFYTFTGQNSAPPNLRGSIPIGTDEDGTVYYLQTRGVNIFGHISNLLSGDGLLGGTFTTALQSSAPVIKTAAEQATGRDLFLDRPFTRKDIETSMTNSSLWRFDPETGQEREVTGKVRPALMEHLMRNFIPQYLLLETVLSGGQKRYTAEGMDEILKDLIREPGQRKAVVEDIITRQGTKEPKWGLEFYKQLGMNITDVTAQDRVGRQKAKEAATTALKNKLLPILNEDFKSQLKKRVMEEVAKGTPKDELKAKVKTWIVRAVTDLKVLEKPAATEQSPQTQ